MSFLECIPVVCQRITAFDIEALTGDMTLPQTRGYWERYKK